MNTEIASRNKGRLYLVAAAVGWGLAGVCVKSITWGSMPIIAVRSFISIIMLLIVRGSLKLDYSKATILGAISASVTSVLYLQAIKLTTAGTAIVLQYIAPILVFLFAVIFQHRKPKLSETIITALVFGGIVLSFSDSLDASHVLGNFLGLASGFTFAGQIIILNDEKSDSESALIIGCFISFIIALPFLLTDKSVVFTTNNIIWVLILSIVQFGFSSVMFSRGIPLVDKVEASLILTIEPIFNPIPVAIFCGEMMGSRAIIGSVIVIVGVTIYGLLPTIEERRTRKY